MTKRQLQDVYKYFVKVRDSNTKPIGHRRRGQEYHIFHARHRIPDVGYDILKMPLHM